MGASDRETKILNPEVTEKPERRQFAAAYKLRVLEQADRCSSLEEIGALLRREALYSSHLSNWRRERRKGALGSMLATTRGRPAVRSAEEREIERLRRDNERLRGKLAKAEKIIDVQKNSPRCAETSAASGMLGFQPCLEHQHVPKVVLPVARAALVLLPLPTDGRRIEKSLAAQARVV